MYEEFFKQGDLEKDKGLPVSFLCDRENTKVNKMQAGFLNGVVIPLYKTM